MLVLGVGGAGECFGGGGGGVGEVGEGAVRVGCGRGTVWWVVSGKKGVWALDLED